MDLDGWTDESYFKAYHSVVGLTWVGWVLGEKKHWKTFCPSVELRAAAMKEFPEVPDSQHCQAWQPCVQSQMHVMCYMWAIDLHQFWSTATTCIYSVLHKTARAFPFKDRKWNCAEIAGPTSERQVLGLAQSVYSQTNLFQSPPCAWGLVYMPESCRQSSVNYSCKKIRPSNWCSCAGLVWVLLCWQKKASVNKVFAI